MSAPIASIIMSVSETIRELGEVPSGELYAVCSGVLSLDQYQAVVALLKRARLVEETPAHLLRWVGPTVAA